MTEQEIRALERMLDKVDYYRLLKIDHSAHAADVRGSYHAARRRFNPDRYLQAPPDLHDAVSRIARRITEAYLVLRDIKRRRAYDKALEAGDVRFSARAADEVKSEDEARKGQTPSGRKFYSMALQEESRGDIGKAMAHLKMALTFEPQNAHFKEHLGRLKPPKKSFKIT